MSKQLISRKNRGGGASCMFLPGFTRVRQAKAYLEYCGARYGLRNRNSTQFIASDSGVFTQDWFSYHIPLWKRVLEPFVAKPIRALEIGVFEGRSAVWLLDHVLTHPESTFTWIDPFIGPTHRVGIDHPNDLEARFRNNIGRFGGKTQGYVGRSQEVLREFSSVRFDLIYIDGAHFAPDVLADAVLSWPLLRSGGLMGFDDYGWRPWAKLQKSPALAVDVFMAVMAGQFEVVHRGYQVWLRKLPEST